RPIRRRDERSGAPEADASRQRVRRSVREHVPRRRARAGDGRGKPGAGRAHDGAPSASVGSIIATVETVPLADFAENAKSASGTFLWLVSARTAKSPGVQDGRFKIAAGYLVQ